ncbi:diguanylate cyclase domain-containing protein [Pelomonas sp. KK5]|uniref:diguanylate cyclase domain-containing protein n=1 Tax=Pelomonas sp. KK5 TaxID=1855730 RepID=UPI00097BCB87|nr:diguanylate cyclase [Pelomonas sp. KK5]
MKVFLVEDSVSIRRLVVRRLEAIEGLHLVGEAATEAHALALVPWAEPEVVLLDLSLADGGSGLRVLPVLRSSGFTGHIAVLTSQDGDLLRRRCLELGADAFYDKGSGLETLFDDLAERATRTRGADDLPFWPLRDRLTGLFDEQALRERLDQSIRAATRDDLGLAVYVLRLEGLAELGAGLADPMALELSRRLGEACGAADIVARLPGDQYCVVLTRLDEPRDAGVFAARLHELMSEPFMHDRRALKPVVKIGMARFPTDAVSASGLLTLAEAAACGAV